jgi:hypothetical protein
MLLVSFFVVTVITLLLYLTQFTYLAYLGTCIQVALFLRYIWPSEKNRFNNFDC